jgi:hypothetical protein
LKVCSCEWFGVCLLFVVAVVVIVAVAVVGDVASEKKNCQKLLKLKTCPIRFGGLNNVIT